MSLPRVLVCQLCMLMQASAHDCVFVYVAVWSEDSVSHCGVMKPIFSSSPLLYPCSLLLSCPLFFLLLIAPYSRLCNCGKGSTIACLSDVAYNGKSLLNILIFVGSCAQFSFRSKKKLLPSRFVFFLATSKSENAFVTQTP